jgi:RNA polymerase sigma-70 factor, ECF subfamily
VDPPGVKDAEATDTSPPIVAARTFDSEYADGYGPLVRLLWSLTGRWPVAEEVAQEAWVAAYRNWQEVSGYDRPDLWVRRVAINRVISGHRKLVSEAAALTRVRANTPVASEPAEQDDAVWRAVRRLPRRQAVAVVLTAVEGRSAEEIGVVLGCSGETARTHFRRGVARLRETLEEVDE